MTLFQPFLTFSTEVAVVSPGGYEDRRARPALQYSAVTTTETRLPDGMRPLSLIANRTGLLFVGDLVSSHPSEAERTVQGSLQYIRHVAASLPISQDDERLVDALVAKRTAGLGMRPLRRREGVSG